MLITNVQEDNKDNKDTINKNILMIVHNKPQILLSIENPIKSYLGTSIVNQPIKTIEKTNDKSNDKKNYMNNYINNNKKNETQTKKCWCYNKESQDMRCCGLCYTFCYDTNKDKQCYMCPETFEIYYTSGYIITTCGGMQNKEDCENCVPTTFCFPLKFAMFWPCLFGSLFNNSINYCRNTNTNYLC